MKNIILIAAPAAGKGTEAEKIKNQFNIPHISTGDLLRDAKKISKDLSAEIEIYQNEGKLVPSNIVLDLLKERILQSDCNNGYILDGFPRDTFQAKEYEKILKEVNKDLGIVILLDIDKEIAKSRISGRVTCPKCKKVYNKNNIDTMPKVANYCDDCNVELIHREDDSESIYDKRYEVYIEQTEPLISYYESKGILYRVDASESSDRTHEKVLKILSDLNE